MTRTNKQQAGQAGEDAALRHLQAAGLKLIERNYHCRWGEVDLIMQEADCIVFVEVRLRAHQGFGGGAASVDARKQAKLQKTALHYLQQKRANARQAARIDVVAVQPSRDSYHCDWIPNAVQG